MHAISAEEILQLLREGEGPHVEFKSRFTADRLIARHVAAFANSGGGTLIIGVSDTGEVVGLEQDEEKQTLNRLKRLAESLLPIFVYSLGSVQIAGKSVAYLRVDQAPEFDGPIRGATGDTLVMRNGVTVEVPAQMAATPSRTIRVFVAMSFRNEEEPALVDYFEAMQRAKEATKPPIDLVRMDLVEGLRDFAKNHGRDR
jgi:predicted HTH transcriptional regulator